MISVMYGVWKAVAIKPDTCEHVATLLHTFFGECGDEGMTLLNSCQLLKSWPCLGTCDKQLNQSVWIN